MCKTKLLLLCIAAMAGTSVMAQSDSTVEVGYDKKTIYTDSLALPHSVNVGALLRLLPELLQRPTDFVLSNYEVKVDGVSMQEADDAVLSIVQLEDVEKIEVENSPTSTDLNNGQSGSINICLRPMNSKPKGLSGSVGLGLASDVTVTPNLMLDYRGEKLNVRAMAFGEYFDTRREERTLPLNLLWKEYDTFRQQLVRATAEYAIDEKNCLSLTLTEATDHSDTQRRQGTRVGEDTGMGYATDAEESGLCLMSELKYSHLMTSARKLTLIAKYTHTPETTENTMDATMRTSRLSAYGNDWQGEATLEDQLSMAHSRLAVGYKVGVKGAVVNALGFLTSTAADEDQEVRNRLESHVNSLMPLAELSLAYGPLSVKLGAEYQWNSGKKDNAFTGRLAMLWQMNPENRLRLNLVRMPRPVEGVSEAVGIDYITGYRWGGHQFTASAGVNYCYDTGELDYDHYYCANVMGIYQYGKRFFCSLTGNLYSKDRTASDGLKGHYDYCNLSLMPSVILGHGWRVATNLRYYSMIDSDESYSTPSTILQVNGGKSWGAWSVYAYARTPLNGKDRIDYHASNVSRYYEMMPASVGCGVTWRGSVW